MAKGDDAVRRKRNKTNRKRMCNSESAVSARVAAIIAAKRRRKAGKRRICEGMCFSLPTTDDPFNDRQGKKTTPKQNTSKRKSPPLPAAGERKQQRSDVAVRAEQPVCEDCSGNNGDSDFGCPSKFLILCLNAIQDAWKEQQTPTDDCSDGSVLAFDWGVKFLHCCSVGSHVIDASGTCAGREQVAWLVSTASDIITRKEKQGEIAASPFLLYLVPTQEKAVQVRSICKPLKALGIHTVSLHPGAPLDHQVQGLKSCEPEFLVSTPERLLELVSLRAIDISGVSLLVLDGLKDFLGHDFVDKFYSIRETISGNPQVVLFGDWYYEALTLLAQNLLPGRVTRLCENDTIASQSAFISQHVHSYTTQAGKIAKIKEVLTGTSADEVLIISGTQELQQKTIESLLCNPRDFYDHARKMSGNLILSYLRIVRPQLMTMYGALHLFFCEEDAHLA